MSENRYSVYCHINKKNLKMYFGITNIKPKYRWNNGKGYKTQKVFYNAIKKYGWDNFEHIIIKQGITEEEACFWEKEFIKKYNTTNRDNGYNLSTGGIHYSHTEETKKLLSEIHKGKHNSPKTEFKNGCIPLNKGKKMPLEAIEKLRERAKGNKYNLGHKWSKEQKQRMSSIKKGKHSSPRTEFKKGQTAWNKGVPMTKEKYEKCKATMFQKGREATNKKTIICVELNIIFKSLKEAEEKTGISRSNICNSLKGKRNMASGYHWQYVEPEYE